MNKILLLLPVLACSVGMGLMMCFMAKGMRGKEDMPRTAASPAELRAEQARLADEIARLEQVRTQRSQEPVVS